MASRRESTDLDDRETVDGVAELMRLSAEDERRRQGDTVDPGRQPPSPEAMVAAAQALAAGRPAGPSRGPSPLRAVLSPVLPAAPANSGEVLEVLLVINQRLESIERGLLALNQTMAEAILVARTIYGL
jgi:hypothetical protein